MFKNRTKRLYPCTLDLSDPDMTSEELEPIPGAPSLQMIPLLMGVAGSWWRPLLAISLIVFREGKGKVISSLVVAGWW